MRFIIRSGSDVTRAGTCKDPRGGQHPCVAFSRNSQSGMSEAIVAYHELAHAWDAAHNWTLSKGLGILMGAKYNSNNEKLATTDVQNHGNFPTSYAGRDASEDFAESVKNTFRVKLGLDPAWAQNKNWSDNDPYNSININNPYDQTSGNNIGTDSLWYPPFRMDRYDYVNYLTISNGFHD